MCFFRKERLFLCPDNVECLKAETDVIFSFSEKIIYGLVKGEKCERLFDFHFVFSEVVYPYGYRHLDYL